MKCPFCASLDTQVKDSRPSEDGTAVRRRRVCPDCGARFTTFERVQLRELTVLKRSGRRVPFDREKLRRSIAVAVRKRPVDEDGIDKLVSEIVRQLESQGESEIGSETIGQLVMQRLRDIDTVAYVRFASVYQNFREPKDFENLLGEIAHAAAAGGAER
jgi:transcriptional repressor NrdR